MVKRPNRAVLREALDEFRDAMRLFIVRGMRRIRGKPIEKVIYDSLAPNRANQFRTTYKIGTPLEVRLTSGIFWILSAQTIRAFSVRSFVVIRP